jgi:DNA-binding transcriptional MerR regulator
VAPTKNEPKLTTHPAALVAKVSATHLIYEANRGVIPVEKTASGLRLFERADLERYAAEREQKRREAAR